MICRISLIVLSLFLAINICAWSASRNDSIMVDGTVVDAITGEGIEHAKITFMQTDSTVVTTGETIDLCKEYGIDDGSIFIRFNIPIPHAGKYILRVSCEKYEDKFVNIDIPVKQYRKKVVSWVVPDIELDRNYTTLGEAVVTASKIMMVNRGDTIMYNASAFNLAEGSMLDALIAQLPGVRLTADGQIFVNDKYVSSLLINGKDFFQGNPGIALRNLPAYTVDKVKAYRRGDKADYLFERDSTEKLLDELVLDVALKKEFMGSLMANADVGYGTDERYAARIFGMLLTNKQRIAAFANINNIGMQQKPGEYIDLSSEAIAGLPITEKSGGVDFFAEMGRHKVAYNSSLAASHKDSKSLSETSANSTFPGHQYFSRSRQQNSFRRTEVEWRNMLSVPLPKMYSEITFGVEYGKHKNHSYSQSVELGKYPSERYRLASLDSIFGNTASTQLLQSLINRYGNRAYANSDRHLLIGSVLSKWKAPLTGSPISIYAEIAYEKQSSDNNMEYSLVTFPKPSSTRRGQREGFGQSGLAGKARIDYEYSLPANMKIVAIYSFSAERTQSDRALDTMFLSTNAEVARLFASDFFNSYKRTLRKSSHTPELQWKYASPKWLISARFPVRLSNTRFLERRFSGQAANPRRKYTVFEPSLSVNGNKGLAFTYSYNQEEPNFIYLTGIEDTSNPLSKMLGNENLENRRIHKATVNYSLSKSERVQNLGLSGLFLTTQNDVALRRLYDSATGISSYTPINVNGNYDLQFNASYSQAVGKRKCFFPEFITQLNITRTIGYSLLTENGDNSSIRMAMKSFGLSQQLGVKYQVDEMSVKLLARGEWLHGVSSHRNVADVSIRKFRYGVIATLPLVWDLRFSTDFSLHTLRGYEDKSMNTNNFVLNASLSRSFLRYRSLTLQLTGFDILNQLSDIKQTVNAMGRIETWTNSLSRYAMLHLIYRFNKKPKGA